MHFAPNQKFIISISFSIFITGAMGGAFWKLYSQVEVFDTDLKTVTAGIAAKEGERKNVRAATLLSQAREADLNRIQAHFISRTRPIKFIEDLEALAQDTRNLIAIARDEIESAPPFLAFRLTVDGSEESVLQYLSLLELMPYEILIEEVAFQRLSGEIVRLVESRKKEKVTVISETRLVFLIKVKAL